MPPTRSTEVVGRPLDFTIVSIDGTPMPAPKVLTGGGSEGYLLGQGGRVAILVQGASDPAKVVRLVQVENRSGTGERAPTTGRAEIGGCRDYNAHRPRRSSTRPVGPGRTSTPRPAHPELHRRGPTSRPRRSPTGARSCTTTSPRRPRDAERVPGQRRALPAQPVDQPRSARWRSGRSSTTRASTIPSTSTPSTRGDRDRLPVNPDYKDPPGQYPPVQYVTDLSQPAPADVHRRTSSTCRPRGSAPTGCRCSAPDGSGQAGQGRAARAVRRLPRHLRRALPPTAPEDRGMMSLVRTIPNDPVSW